MPDPPELAARAGEVEAHVAEPASTQDLPAVVVAIEPEQEPETAPARAPTMIVDNDEVGPG